MTPTYLYIPENIDLLRAIRGEWVELVKRIDVSNAFRINFQDKDQLMFK